MIFLFIASRLSSVSFERYTKTLSYSPLTVVVVVVYI